MATDLGGGGSNRRRSITPKNPRPTAGGFFQSVENRDYGKHVSNLNRQALDAYNQALLEASNAGMGGAGGFGGGGGGYGGRGGGGGGGGYVDRYAQARKDMTAKLDAQKAAAAGALPGFLAEFNKSIGGINAENQALTSQYSKQINALMNQLLAQSRSAEAMLGGDLGAQGAGLRPLQSQAAQAQLGISNIGTAQDVFNRRLAQVMAGAAADRKAAGAQTNQAAQGALENSYLQALMQIQGMR